MFPSQRLHLLCNACLARMLADSFRAGVVYHDSPISQSATWSRWPVRLGQLARFVGNCRGRLNIDLFVDDCSFCLSSHPFPSSGRKTSIFLLLTTLTQLLPVWYLGEADFSLLFIEVGHNPGLLTKESLSSCFRDGPLNVRSWALAQILRQKFFLRFRITIYLRQCSWAVFLSTWI